MPYYFCNPNQILAGIDVNVNVNDNVMTFYFHKDTVAEGIAYSSYIRNRFRVSKREASSTSTSFQFAADVATHRARYHTLTGPLVAAITHIHLVFDYPVTSDVMNALITVTETYQDKENARVRKMYEDQARNLQPPMLERFINWCANFLNSEKTSRAHLPVITKKNLKRIQNEFNKTLEDKSFVFSSREITNFLNTSVEKHALTDYPPTQNQLKSATCPAINDLARESQSELYLAATVIAVPVAALSILLTQFWFTRRAKPAPAQQLIPANNGLRNGITS